MGVISEGLKDGDEEIVEDMKDVIKV